MSAAFVTGLAFGWADASAGANAASRLMASRLAPTINEARLFKDILLLRAIDVQGAPAGAGAPRPIDGGQFTSMTNAYVFRPLSRFGYQLRPALRTRIWLRTVSWISHPAWVDSPPAATSARSRPPGSQLQPRRRLRKRT